MYHTILNFFGGSVEKKSDSNASERLAIVAFVSFTFFTLAAYGGSNAAAFVADTVKPE